MKSRFALLAVLVVAASPLAAQGGGGGGGMGRGMGGGINVEQMTTLYSLTPDQVAKATELKKAYDASTAGVQAWMTKLRESGDMAAMRDAPGAADSMKKMTTAREAYNAEFKKILTPTQAAKFDSVAAARAARMRPAGGM
ncbi:MAG: Spy/CpxP family protein refolding chaperone [Gemmatimonadota bacterium]